MKIRKIKEKIIEGVLFSSSTLTTLVIILITLFLFKEGVGLFGKKPIANDLFVAVNKANPVTSLNADQMKDIFDQKITHWSDVGGKKDSIILISVNNLTDYFTEDLLDLPMIPLRLSELVDSFPNVLVYFPHSQLTKDFKGRELQIDKISLSSFLYGKSWYPTSEPVSSFGILPMILGTLWVSVFAVIIALALGIPTAIFISELAPRRVRLFLKPMIELLAGIPSVVYGFFGLVVIVPGIQKLFNLPVGETALAGSIILALMALPTIISISEDAMRNTPRILKEASLALGASKWQTIKNVVVPYSSSGILAAAVLGIGRAVGETMAVLMVTGNSAVIPHTLLQPVRTIPATIAAELGETTMGGLHYKALFSLGIVLFVITLAVNLAAEWILKKQKRHSR